MYFISFVRDGGHECLNKDPCVIFFLLYQQTLASVGQSEKGGWVEEKLITSKKKDDVFVNFPLLLLLR